MRRDDEAGAWGQVRDQVGDGRQAVGVDDGVEPVDDDPLAGCGGEPLDQFGQLGERVVR